MMITRGYEKKKLTKSMLFWSPVKTLLLASLIYGGKVNGQHRQSNFQCIEEGYHADPQDCHVYYRCVSWGNSGPLTKFKFECGPGTVFSHSKQDICVHPNESERPECNESRNDLDSNMDDLQSNQKEEYPHPSWSSSSQVPANHPTYIPPKTESTSINDVYPSSMSTSYITTQKPSYTGESSYPSSSSKRPSSTEKSESVDHQSAPVGDSQCQNEGFMADPKDCTKFIRCVYSGSGVYQKYEFTCGKGTVWDTTIEGCNHAWAVKGSCSSEPDSIGDVSSDTTQSKPNEQSTVGYDKPTFTPSYPTNPSQSSGYPPSETHSPPPSGLYPTPYPSLSPSTTRLPQTTSLTTTSRPTTVTQKPPNQNASTLTKPSTSYLPVSMPTMPSEPSSVNPPYSTASPATSSSSMMSSESDFTTSDALGTSRPSESGCSTEGFFADPKNCRKFYRCVQENQSFTKYNFECGEGTAWDSSIQACNHEYAVPQCQKSNDSLDDQMTTVSTTEDRNDQTTSAGDSNDQLSSTEQSKVTTQKQPQSSSSTSRPEPTSATMSSLETSEPSTTISSTEKITSDSLMEPSSSSNGPSSENPMFTESLESSKPTSESSATLKPTMESSSLPSSTPLSTTTEPNSLESSPTTMKTDESTKTSELLSTTSSTTPNKQHNSGSSTCEQEGFYADPEDCRKFYRCVKNNGGYVKYNFDCAPGTAWDQSILTCNYMNLVQSCNLDSNKMSSSAETKGTEKPVSATTEVKENNADEGLSTTSSSSNIDSTTTSTSSTNSNITTTTTSSNIDTAMTSSSEKNNDSSELTDGSSEKPTTQNLPSSSPEQKPMDKIECTEPGFYAHPTQCDKFYRCVENDNGFSIYHFDCPPGTIFDPSISVCNYPESVYPSRGCGNGSSIPDSNPEVTSKEPPTTSAMTTAPSLPNESTTIKPSDETTTDEITTDTSESTEALTGTTGESSEVSTMTTETMKTEETTNTEESTTTSDKLDSQTENPDNVEMTESSEQTTETEKMTTTEESNTESVTPTKTDVDTEMKAPCTLGNLTDEQIVLVCPTGFRRHPKYCNMFYQCTSEGNMEIKVLILVCPENTIFDEEKVQCLAESESSQACDTQVASARLYRQIEKLSSRPVRATSNNLCPEEGHYPYQKGCSNIFYKCRRNQRNSIQGYLYRCPDDFVYWSVSRRCERENRLRSCSQLQNEDREEMDIWKKRWEIPIEESNLSARMMHF